MNRKKLLKLFFVTLIPAVMLLALYEGYALFQNIHTISPIEKKSFKQTANLGLSALQKHEINLTTAKVSIEKIEKWIRTAGSADPSTNRLRGQVFGKDIPLLLPGQNIRAFPLVGREPVLQGKITRLIPSGKSLQVETNIVDNRYEKPEHYVMEIIVNLGRHLVIPNEVIIEEEGRKVVYVHEKGDFYFPRNITAGHQGELYTQVLSGLDAGEEIVTFGSFFLDAEFKLISLKNQTALNSSNEQEKNSNVSHRH